MRFFWVPGIILGAMVQLFRSNISTLVNVSLNSSISWPYNSVFTKHCLVSNKSKTISGCLFKCLLKFDQLLTFNRHVHRLLRMQKPKLRCQSQKTYNVQFEITSPNGITLQSNLCTTTTPGTPKQWPLLTCGRCSKELLCYKR